MICSAKIGSFCWKNLQISRRCSHKNKHIKLHFFSSSGQLVFLDYNHSMVRIGARERPNHLFLLIISSWQVRKHRRFSQLIFEFFVGPSPFEWLFFDKVHPIVAWSKMGLSAIQFVLLLDFCCSTKLVELRAWLLVDLSAQNSYLLKWKTSILLLVCFPPVWCVLLKRRRSGDDEEEGGTMSRSWRGL